MKRMENIIAICKLFLSLRLLFAVPFLLCFASLLLVRCFSPKVQTALLDLLHEIRGSDIERTIGGGFGIYLKADYVRSPRILLIGQGFKDG